jgi:predicted nuclease with TOPRIM domain
VNRQIQVVPDEIAEKLDEMADLCEYWKKNREKGRRSNAIRAALLMLASECSLLDEMERRKQDAFISSLMQRQMDIQG